MSHLRTLALLPVLLATLALPTVAQPPTPVRLGIDVLRERQFAPLRGKRVGLVANPASVDSQLQSTVDILRQAPGINLVALFGPEHGVFGDEYAGATIEDRKDPRTGLTIYSLYGATRKPTKQMLDSIDVLVFDLQDIGSRSYTYVSTMKLCLEACAENDKDFLVLDRPNPLGGVRVEGPGVEAKFESFISALPIPYVHGMTMGELARFTRDLVAPDYTRLVVIPMEGWTREMVWADTGLTWIATSPHVPHADSTWAYAATGIAGELMQVSNGVGYTLPFEVVGHPDADAHDLSQKLHASFPIAKGVLFRPVRFKPFYATHKAEPCQGVQLHLDPRTAPSLLEINFRVLEALDAPKLLAAASPERLAMFDKACGTDAARRILSDRGDLAPLFAQWKQSCEAFRAKRKPYLLY